MQQTKRFLCAFAYVAVIAGIMALRLTTAEGHYRYGAKTEQAEALIERALSARAAQRSTRAEELLKSCQDLQPHWVEATTFQAEVLCDQKRYDEALFLLGEAAGWPLTQKEQEVLHLAKLRTLARAESFH